MAHQRSVPHGPSPAGARREEPGIITSRHNQWMKRFRAALRGNGPRQGEPIGVEGPKLVEDALRSGLEAEALLVSEAGGRAAAQVLRAASESQAGVPRLRILRITNDLFKDVAGTDSPQGLAALLKQRAWTFDDILRGPETVRESAPLVIVLAAVQDPGNVGTILRSAEAFGATGAVAARGTADPWAPKALRASAGSALRLPLLRGMAIPVILAQLRIAGVRVYATASTQPADARAASGSSSEADFCEPAAIFVGSEGSGVPPEVMRAADGVVSIPTRATVDSLNAGVAASIVLYQAARQRERALRSKP